MSLIEATPADWATVPAHLHEGIRRWVDDGIVPGGFLQAVICNDLYIATSVSGYSSESKLPEIVRFFVWCVPAACWGSPDALKSWPKVLHDMHAEAS